MWKVRAPPPMVSPPSPSGAVKRPSMALPVIRTSATLPPFTCRTNSSQVTGAFMPARSRSTIVTRATAASTSRITAGIPSGLPPGRGAGPGDGASGGGVSIGGCAGRGAVGGLGHSAGGRSGIL